MPGIDDCFLHFLFLGFLFVGRALLILLSVAMKTENKMVRVSTIYVSESGFDAVLYHYIVAVARDLYVYIFVTFYVYVSSIHCFLFSISFFSILRVFHASNARSK